MVSSPVLFYAFASGDLANVGCLIAQRHKEQIERNQRLQRSRQTLPSPFSAPHSIMSPRSSVSSLSTLSPMT